MREIKFRGWDKEQSKMLSHEDIDQLDKDGVAHWMDIIKVDSKDGIIPMQFTGLQDKNKKDIYEGDIIEFNFWNKSGVAKMTFEQGAFGYSKYSSIIELDVFQSFSHWDEPEVDCYPFISVIGSIYENPELLNTK